MKTREEIEKYRDEVLDMHGVRGGIWSQMFANGYVPSVFCEDNRDGICEMYRDLSLMAYECNHCKEDGNVVYYYGVDEFLNAYRENEFFMKTYLAWVNDHDDRYTKEVERINDDFGMGFLNPMQAMCANFDLADIYGINLLSTEAMRDKLYDVHFDIVDIMMNNKK